MLLLFAGKALLRLQNSPYFCVFKCPRAVKQNVWNESENREWNSGETLKTFFLSPHTLRARKTLTTLFTDFFTDFEKKNRSFFSLGFTPYMYIIQKQKNSSRKARTLVCVWWGERLKLFLLTLYMSESGPSQALSKGVKICLLYLLIYFIFAHADFFLLFPPMRIQVSD